MKKLKFFSLIAVVMMACAMFVSCGDDSDGGSKSLKGYWVTKSEEGWKGYQFCRALYFQNSNTVLVYQYVANGRYWDNYSESFGGKSGWYYQGYETRTYVVNDNKVYISDGKILTISGDRLVSDGGSYDYGYYKCK